MFDTINKGIGYWCLFVIPADTVKRALMQALNLS